ncbi:hypothetical protein [Coxiella-like endosymbiont]|uniref:hypothetical protein n=1 Tax=Coxiella-like endosymbiont TaxID=1592897 RepID=UPI00272B6000|nr:hypothetical protein [Coxiella-like endosymbiont]
MRRMPKKITSALKKQMGEKDLQNLSRLFILLGGVEEDTQVHDQSVSIPDDQVDFDTLKEQFEIMAWKSLA